RPERLLRLRRGARPDPARGRRDHRPRGAAGAVLPRAAAADRAGLAHPALPDPDPARDPLRPGRGHLDRAQRGRAGPPRRPPPPGRRPSMTATTIDTEPVGGPRPPGTSADGTPADPDSSADGGPAA